MFSYNYKLALFLIIVCSVTVTHATPYPTELTTGTYQVTNTAGRDPNMNVPIARQIHNADYGASNGPPPSPDSPPPAQAQPQPAPPPAQNAAPAPTPQADAAKSKRAMRFGPGPVVYHPEPSPSSDPSSDDSGERKASKKRGGKHAS